MKFTLFLMMIGLGTALCVLAEAPQHADQSAAQEVIKESQEVLSKKLLEDQASLQISKGSSCQSCQSQSINSLTSSKEKRIQPSGPAASSTTTPKELLVFVSLGMPEASLQQLGAMAEKTGARLLVRGLIDNSFLKTRLKIQALNLRVEIDPTLFELFEVERVPTFIRCHTSPEGPLTKGHDRLSGNISLEAALEKLQELGDLS